MNLKYHTSKYFIVQCSNCSLLVNRNNFRNVHSVFISEKKKDCVFLCRALNYLISALAINANCGEAKSQSDYLIKMLVNSVMILSWFKKKLFDRRWHNDEATVMMIWLMQKTKQIHSDEEDRSSLLNTPSSGAHCARVRAAIHYSSLSQWVWRWKKRWRVPSFFNPHLKKPEINFMYWTVLPE